MAAKSFDDTNGNGITRQNDLDAGDTFGSIGGGPGAANLSALRYQGTAAGARRVNSANTDYGFDITEGTTRNTTTAAFRTFGFKGFIANVGDLNPNGLKLRLGSAGTAYHEWIMGDDGTILAPGFRYSLKGGFIVKFVDATLRAWLNGTTGNPDETAIDVYAITANISATSNGENLALDALDWVETGFHAVGGDGADADITFDDFVDQDEGESSTNFDRVGLWQTDADVIFVRGRNVIGRTFGGTVTASAFTDEFKTLVYPGDYTREGFNTLEFDISDATTTVALDSVSIIGSGRSGVKRLFDATATPTGDVDTAADTIAYTAHGLSTGEQVLYSQEGETGTVVSTTGGESQLVTGTTGAYYYAINVTADTFAVASSFANALAGTRVALTAQTGETHSFTRTPDTRPDILFTGDATPGTATLDSCILNGCRQITLVDGVTLDGGSVVASGKLFHGDGAAVIDGTNIIAPTTWNTEPFLETEDLDNITNTNWTAGADGGHGIYLNPVGNGPGVGGAWTFSWSGNEASGFDETANDGSTGNTFFLVDNNNDNDITINISGSNTTWRYERAAGYTGTVTLVNAVTLTLTGIETDSEVNITNLDDTENFNKTIASEEQVLGSVQAAEVASGGTGYTVNDVLTVSGGTGTPATLTVTAVNSGVVTAVDVTTAGSYSANPANPASVTGGTGSGATFNLDISGTFSYGYDASNAVRVAIVVFNLDFVEVRIEQDLATVDQTIPIQQRGDRVYNNP